MYNDDAKLRDIYEIIGAVRNDLDIITSNQDKLTNKIDSLETSVRDVILLLLNEVRRTNILLKKTIKTNDMANAVKFDCKKLANRSFVVINDDFLTAKEYAKTIADNANKTLRIIAGSDGLDLFSILGNANVNDYVLVNYNCLTEIQKELIMNAMLNNSLSAMVCKGLSSKNVKIELKPINYILYSDMIELIPSKMIEGLDIVT